MQALITYRTAPPGEIEWLADAYLTSLREAIAEARGYWDEKKERDQFREQLRLSDIRVMVLNDRPVGFYMAWPEADHVFLGTLCVIPEYQNRGIGTITMRAIASDAAGKPVRFSVLKANRPARRFYEQLGCRQLSSSQYHDHFEWAP